MQADEQHEQVVEGIGCSAQDALIVEDIVCSVPDHLLTLLSMTSWFHIVPRLLRWIGS